MYKPYGEVMSLDYRSEIYHIFGTTDLAELRRIAAQAKANQPEHNARHAGRKAKFTDEQLSHIVGMRKAGKTVNEIARHYKTSRQTVSGYLSREAKTKLIDKASMRLYYLCGEMLCTVIDVDFRHEKIGIKNYTNKIPLRAFGVLENPTWQDFEIFLQSRCLPSSRAGIKWILKEMALPFYEPMLLIEKTHGRMAEDEQWIQIAHENSAA